MNALINFTKHEGIIPAIESAHALSYVERLAPTMSKEDIIVVTISDVAIKIWRRLDNI